MNENQLNKNVFNYYSKLDKKIYSEIPFMSRVIDLVLIENDTIITFELKMKNWKKAIEQMQEHCIGSDYCYLLMPKSNISQNVKIKIKRELSFYGFGFYLWDEDTSSLINTLEPKKSEFSSGIGNRILLKNIEGINATN